MQLLGLEKSRISQIFRLFLFQYCNVAKGFFGLFPSLVRLFRFIDLRGLYQDLRITSHSCVIVKLNMQHLRSAVFESDLQWRCSIILRVMLLQWNVGNVPSRRRRRRAAEFRAQSNDAVHTVSFTEIYLLYLGNHTSSYKWAIFFRFYENVVQC